MYTGDSLTGSQRIFHPRAHYDIGLTLGNGELSYTWYDGSNGAGAGYSVDKNTWYHITGVWNELDNDVKIFINGKLRETTSQDNAGNPDVQSQRNTIGSRSDNNQDWYQGKIQHVRVYDHALTPQEVQYLYSVGKRGLHTSDRRTL